MMLFRSFAIVTGLCLFSSSATSQGTVTSEIVVSGLSEPLDLQSPANDSRLFIAEKTGHIRIVENGTLLPTPYFDATGLAAVGSFTGLRGFVFHPDYASNGYVYLTYDTVSSGPGDVVIDRITVSSTDPNRADPASRVEILRMTQTAAWHGGGCMTFGQEGYLYLGMGDGHGFGQDPHCAAQDGSKLLGKILRLDVDGGFPYAIPATNPFIADPNVRDEIWHLGLRHPWRYSLDSLTGDMYIADVGQSGQEEIDFAPAGVGGLNYGWKVMEGTSCNSTSSCATVAPCGDASYTSPILTQPTSLNCSITGGYVYRGSAMPSEQGKYFFAAYCSGAIWSFDYNNGTVNNLTQRNAEFQLNFNGITSFGQDAFGELYLIQQNGTIRKIVPSCATGVPYCQAVSNSTGNVATISMTGSAEVSTNNMILHCLQAVPNKPGVFFYGPNQISTPFGDGVRCVGGQIFRLPPPLFTDAQGSASRLVDFGAPPTGGGSPGTITAGSTWNFQFWYRDPAGGPGGFNLSNALAVTFCP